jgi:hypothetical protein
MKCSQERGVLILIPVVLVATIKVVFLDSLPLWKLAQKGMNVHLINIIFIEILGIKMIYTTSLL